MHVKQTVTRIGYIIKLSYMAYNKMLNYLSTQIQYSKNGKENSIDWTESLRKLLQLQYGPTYNRHGWQKHGKFSDQVINS